MELYFATREEWRKWLEENHSGSDGIWVIYYKPKSGKPRIKYDDAVEEALCFGWIDSKLKSVNEDYYIQHFTPRRKRSLWSKLNLQRAKKLIEQGLMQPAGLREYERALADPSIVYDNKDDDEPVVPEDLLGSLKKNRKAYDNFMNFSLSGRRMYLFWLRSAKRPETRQRRIVKIVELSEKNKRPGMM
ncbi:MAG TPA: YdeI/OmpD-associated family protein [Bacteroidales bacterium]|jgi:uncharacterized protein YdeI (YjbR/CyaY-like superfamily)|nr:YdeI/OmpD-associated family protein [Bacteroidales bacterium]